METALMDPSLTQVVQWLLHYKYFVLLPIVMLEGPIITIIAGFLASLGYLDLLLAYVVVVGGDLIADSIYYAAGRWGKEHLLGRWGKHVGLTRERITRLQDYFAKHKGKTLVGGKFTLGIGAPILAAAGMAKVPYWEFLGINLLATLPKSLILLLIGFFFGRGYTRISRYLDYTALGMLALAGLFIILYLTMRRVAGKFSRRE
jgi:membrane protein DedA with SNARE-associated domain